MSRDVTKTLPKKEKKPILSLKPCVQNSQPIGVSLKKDLDAGSTKHFQLTGVGGSLGLITA